MGMGGTFAELFKDTSTFILPISRNQLFKGLSKLKIFKIMIGYRNSKKIHKIKILNELMKVIKLFENRLDKMHQTHVEPMKKECDLVLETENNTKIDLLIDIIKKNIK